MAQTTKTLINRGTTLELELTLCMRYTNFKSIKDPLAYIYKRYNLSIITLSPISVPESDIPIISIGHDRYGIPQTFYNDRILTPAPMNRSGKLIFRWIQ